MSQPPQSDVVFLPLGGCGEIGMNFNLFGHQGQWLAVDCGITLEQVPGAMRPAVQMPDPRFIVDHRDQLSGLLITHAHEDHSGAYRIYGSSCAVRFTLRPLLPLHCGTKPAGAAACCRYR